MRWTRSSEAGSVTAPEKPRVTIRPVSVASTVRNRGHVAASGLALRARFSARHEQFLPDSMSAPTIRCAASGWAVAVPKRRADASRDWTIVGGLALAATIGLFGSGCGKHDKRAHHVDVTPATRTIVVAPVINLSGTSEIDALKITDILASEFASFSAIDVVPVNLALAALARRGKTLVDTPETAVDLAREFGADATVVTAITEFDPYDPPIVSLVMQWYRTSREAQSPAGVRLSAAGAEEAPIQLQRVFNAADDDVLDEIRSFADERDDGRSPYGWRRYLRSQELYVRWCSRTLIRSMLRLDELQRLDQAPCEGRR